MHMYWYLLFVICTIVTIVLYTTCYIVRISLYVQWQLHRIPVHRSGLVHGLWWTGGPGLGSKWILVRNPSYNTTLVDCFVVRKRARAYSWAF